LVFAKDDNHAEAIVGILREEWGRGNEFAQKITYRTTGSKPEELIKAFRTSYYPRIAVTVGEPRSGEHPVNACQRRAGWLRLSANRGLSPDRAKVIATGTDIKPPVHLVEELAPTGLERAAPSKVSMPCSLLGEGVLSKEIGALSYGH
jgi:hypothetical protein